MNKKRRSEISRLITELASISAELDSIYNEEVDCFENMPEGLQYSYNGSQSEDAQSVLESAIESVDEAIELLEEI